MIQLCVFVRLLGGQWSVDRRLHTRYDIGPIRPSVITSGDQFPFTGSVCFSDYLVGVPNDRNTAGTVRLGPTHWFHRLVWFFTLVLETGLILGTEMYGMCEGRYENLVQ